MGDLEAKVSAIKEATRGINNEVLTSNSIMDTLGSGFDKAATLMKGTMNTLRGMMNSGGSGSQLRTVCGLIVAILFIMQVFRYLTSSSRTSPRGSGGAGIEVKLAENATAAVVNALTARASSAVGAVPG